MIIVGKISKLGAGNCCNTPYKTLEEAIKKELATLSGWHLKETEHLEIQDIDVTTGEILSCAYITNNGKVVK